MAVAFLSGNKITATSGDVKPTLVATNSTLLETDTNITFQWNGSSWVQLDVGVGDTVSESEITGTISDSKLASGISGSKITDGTISIGKIANGTAGKIIGFNASTGAVEEQEKPVATEFKEMTTAETFNPDKQSGTIHLVFEKEGITTGTVKFYIDGVLQETIDSASTGQYNKIIKPTTSLQFVSAGGTFSDTQYNGNNNPSPNAYGSGKQGYAISGDGLTSIRGSDFRIHQYNISTAWDLTTEGGYSRQDHNTFTSGSVTCFRYGSNGTYLYAGHSSGIIKRMTMTNAPYKFNNYRVGTSGTDQNFSLTSPPVSGTPVGIEFSSDGTQLYLHVTSDPVIYQYTMSTAWDLTTASYASKSYNTGMSASFKAFAIDPNGVYLYTNDLSGSDTIMHRHQMSTAWDISTASTVDTINISTLTSYNAYPLTSGMQVSSDNKKIYFSSTSGTENTFAVDLQYTFDGNFRAGVS